MRLAATIILYNPDDQLLSNIQSYISEVEFLLIYDNSPTNSVSSIFEKNPKCRYYWDGNNEGISKRLNQAIEICEKEGVGYLLTMDQDSAFQDNDFKKYIQLIKGKIDNNSIGMFGVNPSEVNDKIIQNSILITSGSVVKIEIANKIGGFDNNLFIDEVDHEFCLRLFINHYQTLEFGNIQLQHQFGQKKRILSPKLKYEFRSIYSPIRIYYITRNFFYVNKLYKNVIKLSKSRQEGLFIRLKNAVIYQNAFKSLYYFLRGYIDFRIGRMGKIK